jgi:hypothetical protein
VLTAKQRMVKGYKFLILEISARACPPVYPYFE